MIFASHYNFNNFTRTTMTDINTTYQIELLKQGDVPAFESIYHAFSDRVYSFAYTILKNDAESKEVVQETFFKIWIHRDKLDPQRSFQSYLFTIARNQTISLLRKNKKVVSLDCTHDLSTTNNTEDEINLSDAKEQIGLIIDQLPPRKKEIFLMSRIEGLSNEEIANKLGLSTQTIHNHISVSLSFIKKHLHKDVLMIAFIILSRPF